MITCNLHKIIELRGIKKPLAFIVSCGLTYNIAWRIYNSQITRVDLKHIEAICLKLKCTPNDILEWHPAANSTEPSDHPLQQLRSKKDAPTISQLLQDFPVDKVEELEKAIQQLKGKS